MATGSNVIGNDGDEQRLENPSYEYLRRLEEYLDELEITRFDSSQFKFDNLQGTNYAIKRLKNNIYLDDETFKRIRREIKYHSKVDHPNVIRFYGFSKGKALIADFGISRQLNGSTTSSSAVIVLKKENRQNKKSDIYSLGVIFWELTSGIPPFNNLNNSVTVIVELINSTREKMVESTPLDYANLYNRCWSSFPDQRPTLNEILIELEKLSTETSIEFIINDISTKIDMYVQILDLSF
ncbi:5837_t:CDS:2 [Cetraspora pellucida]|uniref:5837_t:CDS:1 n=1 Tax=Cetraspora pellucida TaxID=1433469 RepID=A0ACA9LMX6_9GLOM|nr:5837_t:CDS:2 [Cetraspora pellucida]